MNNTTYNVEKGHQQADSSPMESSNVPLQSASEIVNVASGKASALAALPIPLVDVAGVVYVQIRMVNDLATLYQMKVDDQQHVLITNTLTALIGKMMGNLASSIADKVKLTSILQESVIKAALAGFMTKVTGDAYIQHLRAGHQIESLTPSILLTYISQNIASTDLSLQTIALHGWNSLAKKYM